jgi:hypothetical protein
MNGTETRLTSRISQLAAVTDDEAARMASPSALTDLAARITAEPPGYPISGHRPAPRQRRQSRRGMLLAVPVAVAAAAVGIVTGVVAIPGTSGPALPHASHPLPHTGTPLPPAAAKALAFTVKDGYITVIVKNPYADPSWYRADFQAHHLDITLRIRPVSPSLVGTVIYTDAPSSAVESEVTMIYGKCAQAPSGGDRCAIGIRVPMDFHGQYEVDFGRAARPGEVYVSANSAFAAGEALYGMKDIVGQPVAVVLAEIGQRHVTAILNDHSTFGSPGKFPGTWYVNDAVPYAPGQVMLFVSRDQGDQSSAAPPQLRPVKRGG